MHSSLRHATLGLIDPLIKDPLADYVLPLPTALESLTIYTDFESALPKCELLGIGPTAFLIQFLETNALTIPFGNFRTLILHLLSSEGRQSPDQSRFMDSSIWELENTLRPTSSFAEILEIAARFTLSRPHLHRRQSSSSRVEPDTIFKRPTYSFQSFVCEIT